MSGDSRTVAGTDPQAALRAVELITGGWIAQLVNVAARMRLPDHIAAGHVTSQALAEAADAEPEGVRRMLRLLVAVGFFEGGESEGYRNTPVSVALLDRPGSLRDMSLLYGEEFYTAWGHAYESVRTLTAGFQLAYGEPLYPHLSRNPDLADRFQRAMRSGNLFFGHVPDVYDFTGRTVADLGGGNGELLGTILAATPDAHGVLLDREHVAPLAKEHLAGTVGLDRVEILGGDMFTGVPQGADVYILCRVLAGWDDDAVAGLFARIREAMPGPGARLLVLDRYVPDEGASVLPALWDLHLHMTNGGRHRSEELITSLLRRAGLEVERTAELPMETTALVAEPVR